MKIIKIIIVAIFAIYSQCAIGQSAKILLQHYGDVKLYESNDLSSAITDAVVGDTIYLTEGTFDGNIVIPKRLSIIGAGQGSIIKGDINVTFIDEDIETKHPRLLDALCVTGDFRLKSTITDMTIRKCNFEGSVYLNLGDCFVQQMTFDRCFINSIYGGNSSHVKNGLLINCKIIYIKTNYSSDSSSFTFQNCNVYQISSSDFKGKLVNSIISSAYYYLNSEIIAINSLFGSKLNPLSIVSQNCYVASEGTLMNSTTLECLLGSDALYNNNYLGIDGTIVGCNGGTTPFTLTPNTPTVSNASISVDPDNNQLNINLKVSIE